MSVRVENKNLRLAIDYVLDSRWKIVKVLGEGAFGAVYEVLDIKRGNAAFALKLEQNNLLDQSQNMLKLEVTVLRQLRLVGARYCPGYESCGSNDRFNYVVMGLVGKSISGMRKTMPNKRFTLRTCLHIGNESCYGIEEIHKIGFIHRDLKPGNLAVGRPPTGLRQIYVLDWGLCRRYVNEDGQMLPPRRKAPYRGSPRYSSVKALGEKEQGRADDIWSWLFTLIDLTVGKLPWDEGGPSATNEWYEWLEKEKARFVNDRDCLLFGCPIEYVKLYEMVRRMEYADVPAYEEYVRILNKLLKRKDYEKHALDWEPSSGLSWHTDAVPMHTMMQEINTKH